MDTVPTTVLCIQCDAAYRRPKLQYGEDATCPRCGAVVVESAGLPLIQSAMLLVASMGLYLIVSYLPMVSVTFHGRRRDVTVWTAITALFRETWGVVTVPVMAFSLLVPLIQAGLSGWMMAFAWRKLQAPGSIVVGQWVRRLRPWSMADVLLVAIVLAAIRMTPEAMVELRGSFWLLLLACVCLSTSSRVSTYWVAPWAYMITRQPG